MVCFVCVCVIYIGERGGGRIKASSHHCFVVDFVFVAYICIYICFVFLEKFIYYDE